MPGVPIILSKSVYVYNYIYYYIYFLILIYIYVLYYMCCIMRSPLGGGTISLFDYEEKKNIYTLNIYLLNIKINKYICPPVCCNSRAFLCETC